MASFPKGRITPGPPFQIQRGVRQDESVSPDLFSLVLEEIFRNLNQIHPSIKLNGKHLNNLRFPDDIVLFAQSQVDLQHMTTSLQEENIKTGLKLNFTKTKVLTHNIQISIIADTHTIYYVEEFQYPGHII